MIKNNTDGNPVELEEIDEETEDLFEADFEIGHFFKEFLIPKAVLYFTGELIDENDEFDEDEEEEENPNVNWIFLNAQANFNINLIFEY